MSLVAAGLSLTILGAVVPEAEIIVDGRCDEAVYASAELHPLTEVVVLHVVEADAFVYFCCSIPDDNAEFADLHVATPSLERPRQLHASAKLGEWDVGEVTPTWWNHNGWTANVAWFDMAELGADGAPRANFLPGPGREFQLSKQRFGSGVWRFMLEVHAIRDGQGFVDRRTPSDATAADASTWHTLAVQ